MLRALRLVPLLVAGGVIVVLLFVDVLGRVLPARAPPPALHAATHPRAVVLGFDGVDVAWLRRYLEAGRLPHLARLLERQGSLHPLRSEIPPESPVAWASLITGVNPGRHGVLDFVRPGPGYRPRNGMLEVRPMRLLLGRVPVRPPLVTSRLAAPTFLERVWAAGYPVLALRQPLLFPARPRPGARMLAGLGTPDLGGSSGFYALWSSEVGFTAGDTVFGGVRIPVEEGPPGVYDSFLPGPQDPTLPRGPDGERRRARVPVRFEVRAGDDGEAVAIHLAGQVQVVEREASLALGERAVAVSGRSGFFHPVVFTLGTIPPRKVKGHVRFEVQSIRPLRVLADPVNLYAPDAPFPLTTPEEYAAQLWRRHGPYETMGWREQTFSLNDGFQDDASFLRDLLEDLDRGAGILLGELARGGRCVFQAFTATDRAMHCFYRYYDADHPARRDFPPHPDLEDPVGVVYERMDRIVGDVWARLDPQDLLVVCSDHGFQPWRWEVNVNAWLEQQGYLVLREDLAGEGPGDLNLARFFGDGSLGAEAVDWDRTRAFAMGLGQVYLTPLGREQPGLVEEIREGLLLLRNPHAEGDRPIREVYLLHEVYRGPHVEHAAELQIGFAGNYRISWQTALLGGLGRSVFEENDRPWSADHCSTDVREVEGILLVNQRLPAAETVRPARPYYHVRDVAATVVAWFGLDVDDLVRDEDTLPLPLPSWPVLPSPE